MGSDLLFLQMFLAFMTLSNGALNVFWLLVDLVACGVLISWTTILTNHWRLMLAMRKQDIPLSSLPWHSRWTGIALHGKRESSGTASHILKNAQLSQLLEVENACGQDRCSGSPCEIPSANLIRIESRESCKRVCRSECACERVVVFVFRGVLVLARPGRTAGS